MNDKEMISDYEISQNSLFVIKYGKLLRFVAFVFVLLYFLQCGIIRPILFYSDMFSLSELFFMRILWGGAMIVLYPMAKNCQTRLALIIIIAYSFFFDLLIGLKFWGRIDSTFFDSIVIVYKSLFWIFEVYAYSLIIRNNQWNEKERSWVIFLPLWSVAFLVDSIDMAFAFYDYEILYCCMIFILSFIWLVACYKLIYSDAFSGIRDSPASTFFSYTPFNKYLLAAILIFLIMMTYTV